MKKLKVDLETWLAKQPSWARMEVRMLQDQLKTANGELAVIRGDKPSNITYGRSIGTERGNVPDDLGPIHFKLDEHSEISVHIEQRHSDARKCLHIAGDCVIAIVPSASNCVRIYPFEG